MKQTATRTRRTFQGEWDEIDYLYMKILHWFYDRGDRRKALPYSARLQTLLETTPEAHEAIFGEECWSLISEVQGDLARAIAYRQREIELIRREAERSLPRRTGCQPVRKGRGQAGSLSYGGNVSITARLKLLHRHSVNTPGRDFVWKNYDYSDLSDRLDLLAILYHDAGDLGKAIQVLKDSRRLCRRHGIPFDGEDLLCDYRAETVAEERERPISR